MVRDGEGCDLSRVLSVSLSPPPNLKSQLTPLTRATPRPVRTSVTRTSSPIVVTSHSPSRVSATGPPVYSGRMELGDARKLVSVGRRTLELTSS